MRLGRPPLCVTAFFIGIALLGSAASPSMAKSPSPNSAVCAKNLVTVTSGTAGEHTLSGPVVVAWEATFDGPASGSDMATSIILRADQQSVVVSGTVTVGPPEDGLWPEMAFGTVAYNARTGRQLWSSQSEYSLLPLHRLVDTEATRNGNLMVLTGYASKSLDMHIVVFGIDPDTGAEQWQFVDRTNRFQYASDLIVSPGSRKVFVTGVRHRNTPEGYSSGVPDGIVASFDADTGEVLWRELFQPESISGSYAGSVAVSPDSRTLYVLGQNSFVENLQRYWAITIIAFDTATGERRWMRTYPELSDQAGGVGNLSVSHDGRTIYSSVRWIEMTPSWSASSAIITFDAATGDERWISTPLPGPYTQAPGLLILSADGRRIFVVSADYRNETDMNDLIVAGYDAVDGDLLWGSSYGNGPGQSEWPSDIAISQSGRMVVVTGQSGTPSLPRGKPGDPPPPPIVRSYVTVGYEAQSGEELWAAHYLGPAGRDGMAASVAIAKNGRRVFVTGYTDGLTGLPGETEDYFTVAYDVLAEPGKTGQGGRDSPGSNIGLSITHDD